MSPTQRSRSVRRRRKPKVHACMPRSRVPRHADRRGARRNMPAPQWTRGSGRLQCGRGRRNHALRDPHRSGFGYMSVPRQCVHAERCTVNGYCRRHHRPFGIGDRRRFFLVLQRRIHCRYPGDLGQRADNHPARPTDLRPDFGWWPYPGRPHGGNGCLPQSVRPHHPRWWRAFQQRSGIDQHFGRNGERHPHDLLEQHRNERRRGHRQRRLRRGHGHPHDHRLHVRGQYFQFQRRGNRQRRR